MSSLTDFTAQIAPKQVWEVNVGGADPYYVRLEPLLANRMIIAANANGHVSAHNARTGEEVWSRSLSVTITGGVGGDDDIVLVGTDQGKIMALHAASGERWWESDLSGEILVSPQVNHDVIVVRAANSIVYAIQKQTGDLLWTYSKPHPALNLRWTSSPLIVDEEVLLGFDSGEIVALDLSSGDVLWEFMVTRPVAARGDIERMSDIDGRMAVHNDVVYISAYQGETLALTLHKGARLWARSDISSFLGLDADQRAAYVTDDRGVIWALALDTGAVLWKQEGLRQRASTLPVVYHDYLVIGDKEGYLHWLDTKSGQFASRIKLDSMAINAPPVPGAEFLYVLSSSGSLSAFSH